ncbi:MAG: hypothetical protein AAFQ82_28310, partial [Myxococcota bacterium]
MWDPVALSVGALAGATVAVCLYVLGALNERSGLAVLVAAIAFFWPVFAVQAESSIATVALHSGVFVLFCLLGAYGFRRSTSVLALGLVAHGAFDGFAALVGHPGPVWWPAFCGALDLVAG